MPRPSSGPAGGAGVAGRPGGRGTRSDDVINPKLLQFVCDVTAAAIATTASSPLNYARNRIYSLPSGSRFQPTSAVFIVSLFRKALQQPTPLASCIFLQQKLKIGAATLRVALSMALAASTYRAISTRSLPDTATGEGP